MSDMFWQESATDQQPPIVPDDIVDLCFKVHCRSLPLDHAHSLSQAIQQELPWLAYDEYAGIHLIHGAESGNGWIRPQGPKEVLFLSRRTRFVLRLSKANIDRASQLDGKAIEVCNNQVTLSEPSVRLLSNLTTLFARYVIASNADDENLFLQAAATKLTEKNIHIKKMLCGRKHVFQLPDAPIETRSLMLDGLTFEESIKLQQEGLGDGRKIGCGIFLPHKSIDAVDRGREK